MIKISLSVGSLRPRWVLTFFEYSKMAPGTPDPAKMRLRDEVSARIAALTKEEKERQSKIVYEKMINHPWYKSSNRIAIFMSTDQEIDTMPLIKHIQDRGASPFVPQYGGGHMKFLKMETGDEDAMPLTKHGIAQHGKHQPREDALENGGLDLIIAPGVAFSLSGNRLGHGGGYYDKFLAKVRSNPDAKTKVLAVAFDCQVVDEVPTNEDDQKIDGVIYPD